MNQNSPIYFLKFGEEKYLKKLLINGTIYCNSLDYFQNLEEQGLRGDNYEGTTRIYNYHEYKYFSVKIKDSRTGEQFPINPTKLHVREFFSEMKGNMYSLYCIRPKDIIDVEKFKIDSRVKDFGSHFLIINAQEFLKRFFKVLDKSNIEFTALNVNYYEKNRHNGNLTLFDKSNEFEYQNEFRFLIKRDNSNPIEFEIGNIEDIAKIFKSDLINDLEISWEPKEDV
ncbi:hypothetical protein [Marixanthomonas ophiurae]|nr:hypothetical protein [Marixanthomonas ophiurae]